MKKKIIYRLFYFLWEINACATARYLGKYLLLFSLLCFSFFGKSQDTLTIDFIENSDSTMVDELIRESKNSKSSPAVLQALLKAQSYIEQENRPKDLFEIYRRIGKIYQSEDLHERALPFFRKANRLPSPPILERKKITLLTPMAKAYFELGQIDSAILMYGTQLSYYQRENDYDGRLKTLQRKVNVFLNIKNYRRALDLNLQVKDVVEKNGDKKHLAIIYNNIGYNFNYLEEYDKAVKYFLQSLDVHLNELMTPKDSQNTNAKINLTILYANIGIAYNNLKESQNAIDFLLQAQKTNNPKQSKISNAYLQHLIGTIYLNNGDVYNSLKFNNVALANAKKNNDLRVLSDTYLTAAKIQQKLYDYELALEFYQQHFALRDSFALEDRFRKQELLQQQLLLEKSEKEIRLLLFNEAIQKKEIQNLQFQTQLLASESEKIKLKADKQAQEFDLLKKEQEIKDANLLAADLEKKQAFQQLSLTEARLLAETKSREAQASKQKEQMAVLEQRQAEARKEKAEQAAQLNERNLNIAELKLQQEVSFRKFAYGLGALSILVFMMILSAWYYSRIANRRLETKNQIIEEEQRKSEELLLNILPVETANELKATGHATPKQYDKVTVLFADFSNFTNISEKLSAQELIQELNECFRAFDEIIDKYGLEKIKTIGDGYMCAGGIPVVNETNPTDAVNAALEMQTFMKSRYAEKTRQGIPYWNMRIGIHTGSVIAGVVGTKKFAYDIWGSTVNIASRMETTCENGKINISSATQNLVNGAFDYTYRGEVEVKHADKVGMYFVNQK